MVRQCALRTKDLCRKGRPYYRQQRPGSEPNCPLTLVSFNVIEVQKLSVKGGLGVALNVKVAATPPGAGGSTDPRVMSQDAPALSVKAGLGPNSFELLLIAAATTVVGYWLLLL